ncbi:hypothetical protein V1517DRAFT_280867 [Lipomyces orientalis]|uniref:Uncharacterized protein n=1 Tax=Lipomyces orientalis TaxID=1233043 RepID=A0ACC3TGH1_9ASCO
MNTRRNRPNYFLLNDGLEASAEDRLDSHENVTTLENDILPSESASQIQQLRFESTIQAKSATSLAPLQEPLQHARISEPKSTNWPWTYFDISEFEKPWIIPCAVLDNETGEKCGWKTTDSKRQGSTGNIIDHLRKQHSIDSPNRPEEPKRAESSILSFIKGKERLTHQLLEKNILRWIVAEKQPFTTLESAAFQQIFHDIPGIRLPFTRRQVVRQRFAAQRVQLRNYPKHAKELLSLWTSGRDKNIFSPSE